MTTLVEILPLVANLGPKPRTGASGNLRPVVSAQVALSNFEAGVLLPAGVVHTSPFALSTQEYGLDIHG